MKAQYSAAEAQVRISEAATGVGEQMADVGLAMQRAADKTEQMRARADAVAELEAAGTFDDLTTLGPGQDDIDRQLSELSSSTQVDDELAKMKAELRQRRRRFQAARGRPGLVIVRISNEGQYRLDDGLHARLNDLDAAAVSAVEAGRRGRLPCRLRGAAAGRAHPGLRARATTTSTPPTSSSRRPT